MVVRCWLIFHSVSLFFLDYSTVDHVITMIITSVMYCIVLYCIILFCVNRSEFTTSASNGKRHYNYTVLYQVSIFAR